MAAVPSSSMAGPDKKGEGVAPKSAQSLARMKSFSGSTVKLVGAGNARAQRKAVPVSSSAAQTWSKGINDSDVWDGREWRPMDRRMAATGTWVESIKEWDVEHDHVPKTWKDGEHFSFRDTNVFDNEEICAIANKKGDMRFARVISSHSGGRLSDIALDATNETNVQDVPHYKLAKLRRDLREGVRFFVNAQEGLITWKKPPDVRDYMYTDAKQQFDQQHWRNAYEKFEDVVYQGKGADWRHTKKYMAVCIEHLKHRRERTAALDAYQDAKRLFDVGHYEHALTAFDFVIEISQLGTTRNFHHTREYIAKCKHILKKQQDQDFDLQDEEGTMVKSDKHPLVHYYTKLAPLGAAAQEYTHAVSKHASSKTYQVMTVPTNVVGLPLTESEITSKLNQTPPSSSAASALLLNSRGGAEHPSETISTRSVVGSRFLVPRPDEGEEEQDVKSCIIS